VPKENEELFCPYMCGLAIVIRDITNLLMGNPNVAPAGQLKMQGTPANYPIPCLREKCGDKRCPSSRGKNASDD